MCKFCKEDNNASSGTKIKKKIPTLIKTIPIIKKSVKQFEFRTSIGIP